MSRNSPSAASIASACLLAGTLCSAIGTPTAAAEISLNANLSMASAGWVAAAAERCGVDKHVAALAPAAMIRTLERSGDLSPDQETDAINIAVQAARKTHELELHPGACQEAVQWLQEMVAKATSGQ